MMSDLLTGLAEWAVDIVYFFGYVGVFVLIALSNLHLPVPSQLVLPLAGFLVGQGRLSFTLVLASSTAAAVLVSLVFYFLGLRIGEEGLRRLVGRLERFKLLFESDLDKASEAFGRHGGKTVLIGHLVPGVGAFISIPAGIKGMPVRWRFLVYTVLGSALWNVVFIALGWALGTEWMLVKQYSSVVEYVVLAAIFGGLLLLVWRRWKARGS
jgi:membrane protein DedA with SNARE-associated domain